MKLTVRGQQPPDALHLSFDRKVAPSGTWQQSRNRWIPTFPNSFGLPAGSTCPGKTAFCVSCYGKRSEQSAGVGELLAHNAALLDACDTADEMTELIDEMVGRFEHDADVRGFTGDRRLFRIHWDGDFGSVAYARAWAAVIAAYPDVLFWAYTRSFRPPVNVVPHLAGLENLVLYLSVDAENIDDAIPMIDQFDVRFAACGVDYAETKALARRLSTRIPVRCPENAGKMPLMHDGEGACVTCQLCPQGRRDIMFASTHREHAVEPRPVRVALGRKPRTPPPPHPCATPGCSNLIEPTGKAGRPRKHCDTCRNPPAPDRCSDCGEVHGSPWAALACDDFTDAARRREAARFARRAGEHEDLERIEA